MSARHQAVKAAKQQARIVQLLRQIQKSQSALEMYAAGVTPAQQAQARKYLALLFELC